jgi:hypothetical protein
MGAFWEMRFDILNYSSSQCSELVINLCCYAAKITLVIIYVSISPDLLLFEIFPAISYIVYYYFA